MPPDGLTLALWEIGGSRGGHLRQLPRGQTLDGLIICYSVLDRASFHNGATILMKLRADRHFDHGTPSLVGAFAPAPPRLPVILCGTKVDEVDAGYPRVVSEAEAQEFAQANGLAHALTTSARAGECVLEAFQALGVAILEAEEDAWAELAAAQDAGAVAHAHAWSLGASGGGDAQGASKAAAMTSPRGMRPGEPPSGGPSGTPLVEIIDLQGVAFGARPLAVCLERGLLHRAVHVWLCDPRTGALLLRKCGRQRPKWPGLWVPSCHSEVLCYGSTADPTTGPHTAELSLTSAQRALQEQLGLERAGPDVEQWFSCMSRSGACHELLDVFVVSLGALGVSQLRLLQGEQVEWVHYLDIFGEASRHVGTLFHIEQPYRHSFVQRMRSRIAHHAKADSAAPYLIPAANARLAVAS